MTLKSDTIVHSRYRIIEQVGRGGQGAVFKAYDSRLQATVALKQSLNKEPKFVSSFAQEAHILANLRHPYLPRVIDHFEEPSGFYLVMEFIDGEDFDSLLASNRGIFTLHNVMCWADQILDALEYLHTRTPPILHRDIKPQNLKTDPEGDIILLDFGLAKGFASLEKLQEVENFGFSFQYASLEQLQGNATTQNDLYSLGVTLYHLLSGTTPVDVLSRYTLLQGGQADPLLPLAELSKHVPTPLSDLISQATAIDAQDRPASATAMRDILLDVTNQYFIQNFLRRFSTALREGYSVKQIFEEFSTTSPAPLANEIRQILAELQNGIPLPKALDNWLTRMPGENLNIIIATVNAQFDIGGNLADKLDLIEHILGKRKRL